MVGGLAERLSCERHEAHAVPGPPSPLRPTKTVCALVVATRAGPEFKKPGTPPTETNVAVPGASGLSRYTFCEPKSATMSCELSGVRARPRKAALGHGPGTIAPDEPLQTSGSPP